ncbi:MAG: AvaI/BsoBI family type II restriction endonuclease [Acidobacteriaceae bacterium]
MDKSFLTHLTSSTDLRTSYAAIRAGFVSLALEKNRRATPFVEEARSLKVAAAAAKKPGDLRKMPEIRNGLLTAAGVSDKAANHLEESDKDDAIFGLIANFLEPAGDNFVEELVFRFLLTRGDTLGGSMRNAGGFMAQKKLTRSIISCLRIAGKPYSWLHSATGAWIEAPYDDADIEMYVKGLSWTTTNGPRTLIYNLTVPLVKNNVDLCLLNGEYRAISKSDIENPRIYLAFGELKGGIDPAGADEHWKTARTALDRIHQAFKDYSVATFFIGAAIEAKMATEIWTLLERGIITNAANLTEDNQIAAISRWLCAL